MPIVIDHFGWQLLVYAVLSLTVVRMVPVALVLRGTKLRLRASIFIGWFGPRGLASVVFALLAVEDLGTRAILRSPSSPRRSSSASWPTASARPHSQRGSARRSRQRLPSLPSQPRRA